MQGQPDEQMLGTVPKYTIEILRMVKRRLEVESKMKAHFDVRILAMLMNERDTEVRSLFNNVVLVLNFRAETGTDPTERIANGGEARGVRPFRV